MAPPVTYTSRWSWGGRWPWGGSWGNGGFTKERFWEFLALDMAIIYIYIYVYIYIYIHTYMWILCWILPGYPRGSQNHRTFRWSLCGYSSATCVGETRRGCPRLGGYFILDFFHGPGIYIYTCIYIYMYLYIYIYTYVYVYVYIYISICQRSFGDGLLKQIMFGVLLPSQI